MDWAQFQQWVTHPVVQSLLIIAMGYLAGLAVDLVGFRALTRVVSSTETDFDDQIIDECRHPVRTSVVLASMWFAIAFNDPLPQISFLLEGLISSWALVIWARALFKVSSLTILWLASIEDRFTAVTRRTVPAWDMTAHLFLSVISAYFFFLAWEFDAGSASGRDPPWC